MPIDGVSTIADGSLAGPPVDTASDAVPTPLDFGTGGVPEELSWARRRARTTGAIGWSRSDRLPLPIRYRRLRQIHVEAAAALIIAARLMLTKAPVGNSNPEFVSGFTA
jgi:hypothetical protein